MQNNNVSKIKDRINIVDVIGGYLKLEKSGINMKARCPFHNEKTPSFFVSPDRGTFKCFGCGASGDIFGFVEQFEGVDFVEALKILAEKAGVVLEKENVSEKNEKTKLYAVMEEATNFFEKNFQANFKTQEYLKKRGLTDKTIKKFRIGFALDDWRKLYDYLKSKKFSDEEMDKVGLIKKTDKGYYDRFRSRIMFPIFDTSGRVIAFSGRIFIDESKPQNKDYEQAKYLNSPETVLFNKSRVLYGYNFAKNDIRKFGFSILVEGQMDIIMSHQAGLANTVATSGTALTSEHLLLLNRLSNKVMMAFDGDKAGLSATNKGAKLALEMGMEVKLVETTSGFDPADLILKDKKEWLEIVKNSVHIIDFNLNVLKRIETDKRKLALRVSEGIVPLIASLKSKIEQSHFVTRISSQTGISEDAIWEEIKNVNQGDIPTVKSNSLKVEIKKPTVLPKKKQIIREIYGLLEWQKGRGDADINVEELENKFKETIGEEQFEKIGGLKEDIKNEILFEIENKYFGVENLEKKIKELFLNLEKENLIEKREEVIKKLKEVNGDNALEENYLKLYSELSKNIEKLSKVE